MQWISILRCPITGSNLRMLDQHEIELLHQKTVDHLLWHADGKPVNDFIDQGLISVNGGYIYPIMKEIVILIKDFAVVDALDKVINESLSYDKQQVKKFYDEKGWHENEAGDYADAVIYEDLREVSREYLKKMP